jgi:kumamolisin
LRRSRLSLPLLAGAVLLALFATPVAAKSPRIHFFFGLERPEHAARAAFWAVQAPGSPRYRRFLGPAAVARRYGASAGTIRALEAVARHHGLSVKVDRSGVFARLGGTVRRLERVFDTRIKHGFNNETNSRYFFAAGRLRIPRDLNPLVREVVPSFSRELRTSAVASAGEERPPGAPRNEGTWREGCAAARATGGYSFAQVRQAYGLDAAGDGAGAAVAIVNVGEGLTASDVAANARCFGLPPAATRTLLADGQRRAFPRDTFEPQEDLALVRGMAPGLTSLTFAQTWLGPELWFLAPANVLDAEPLPDSLSISYGECERDVRGRGHSAAERAGANLMDAVLVRLGLAGVSSFASAGDFGSTCNGQPYPGVAWPASSPFLTAVGGTRLSLDAANRRSDEVVWNDTQWLTPEEGGLAGGGGHSFFSPRPPFQAGDTGVPPSRRRAVPDLSAHASIFPGYPVVLGGNWVADAGTSAAAPLLAGAFAVLSADQRAAGQPPLGPVNGLVYALARSAPTTVFDVVSGADGYSPKVPAHVAGPGYDLASGLGVPDFEAIRAALPPPAP